MNELLVHDAEADADVSGWTRVQVTEAEHPYIAGWWPPGHLIGYEHTFTHQVVDLLADIAAGQDPAPSFADGLQVQRVLAAVEASAASDSRWTPVSGSAPSPAAQDGAAPTLTRS
jgi:predicted dehydrogenase